MHKNGLEKTEGTGSAFCVDRMPGIMLVLTWQGFSHAQWLAAGFYASIFEYALLAFISALNTHLCSFTDCA